MADVRSFALAIFANLATTALLSLFGLSLLASCLVAALLLIAALSIWIFRLTRDRDLAATRGTELTQLRKAGIVDARPSLDQISLAHQLQICRKSLDFLGVSARTIMDNAAQPAIRKALANEPSLKLRFLLFDPRETQLGEQRAQDETGTATTWTSWSQLIRSVVAELQAISIDHPGADIEVRIYKSFPVFRLLIVDHEEVFLNFYGKGVLPTALPALHLRADSVTSLASAFTGYFEECWRTAEVFVSRKLKRAGELRE